MTEMIIRVVDFETTGVTPDAAVCEIGWSDVRIADGGTTVYPPYSRLCNPGRPIPPEACAVHHITDEDVRDAPTAADVFAEIMDGPEVFAAHKAAFEQQFFDGGGKPWICTWKVAIRLAPRAPGHSNQVLRYWLTLAADRELATPAHRAGPDAYVTAHLLARMLGRMTFAEMIALSAEPAILPCFIFGKHAMTPLEDVPSDYLEWCLRQDMDPDVKHTARHYLKARESDKYVVQMLWQMECSGRAWCDFCSFDPRLPEEMRLFIQRVQRDDARIKEITKLVSDFLTELDAKVGALGQRYKVMEPVAA